MRVQRHACAGAGNGWAKRPAAWTAVATLVTTAVALLPADSSGAPAAAGIVLPGETARLKPSTLPGYRIAAQKCGICHSADYIEQQPPMLSLKQWSAEVVKMRNAYGAPIDESEIKPLAVYLALTYGDPGSVDTADKQP